MYFMQYFDDYWMQQTRIRSWNVYVIFDQYRTNNNLEGWHNSFNRRMKTQTGQAHTLYKFLSHLWDEIDNSAIEKGQLMLGNQQVARVRSKDQARKEKELERMKQLYSSNTISFYTFMEGLDQNY